MTLYNGESLFSPGSTLTNHLNKGGEQNKPSLLSSQESSQVCREHTHTTEKIWDRERPEGKGTGTLSPHLRSKISYQPATQHFEQKSSPMPSEL